MRKTKPTNIIFLRSLCLPTQSSIVLHAHRAIAEDAKIRFITYLTRKMVTTMLTGVKRYEKKLFKKPEAKGYQEEPRRVTKEGLKRHHARRMET